MNSPLPDHPSECEPIPASSSPDSIALWHQNQALSLKVDRLQTEIEALKGTSISWRWFFQPMVVFFASLGAMLILAAFVIIDNGLGISPEQHTWFLYYMVPIVAPFVAFLLDRAARLRELHWFQWAIDMPVIIIGLIRAIYPLPGISGHALFLTYALFTTRSRVVQLLSVIILAEVIYLKLFAWHDPTLFGGLLAATCTASLFQLAGKLKYRIA